MKEHVSFIEGCVKVTSDIDLPLEAFEITVKGVLEAVSYKEEVDFLTSEISLRETTESPSTSSNNTYALQEIRTIINGRGDTVTKVAKCKDILAQYKGK